MTNNIRHFRGLRVYNAGMRSLMEIFEISKKFPSEEKYSMTDQVRRSSRSVCANLAEAWRKRRYKAAFIAKRSDSETEAAETQVWLEIAKECGYITKKEFEKMDSEYEKIIGQLVRMIDGADDWLIK